MTDRKWTDFDTVAAAPRADTAAEWQDKVLQATAGTQTGAIIRAAYKRNGDQLPAFSEGGASATSDGYLMAGYTTRQGAHHLGAFVGSVEDLEQNINHVVEHCDLMPDQATALRAAVHKWAGIGGRDNRRVS